MKTINNPFGYAVKNWWLSLLLGILYILAGLCVLWTPIVSYMTISILFSISLIIGGIFELIFAFNNKNALSGWGWNIAGGVLDLIIGIYLIANPGLSMAVLPYVLAFWLLFRGISIIGYSFDLRKYVKSNWGWYLFFGILAILCAIGIFWQPVIGAASIVYIVAFILLFVGIFRVVLAFKLKSLQKKIKNHQEIITG